MHRRIATFALITGGVLAAGGGAVAVANSVSTTPEPAFISHLDKSISDHPTPTTVDDHGHDVVTTPDTVDDHGHDVVTTPDTVDDHGTDNRGPSANSGPGNVLEAEQHHGADDAPGTTTPTTIDDHGQDPTATTPTTIDDNGRNGRGTDTSGSGSRHSGGTDDSPSGSDG